MHVVLVQGFFDVHFLFLFDFVLQMLNGIKLAVVLFQKANMGPQLFLVEFIRLGYRFTRFRLTGVVVQLSVEIHRVLLSGDGSRLNVNLTGLDIVPQILEGHLFLPDYGLKTFARKTELSSVHSLFKHFIVHIYEDLKI